MSEEAKPAAAAAPKKSLPLGLILGALNTFALLGVVGLLYYTKILYKRPVITEATEREKIEAQNTPTALPPTGHKSLVKLEPINANLQPTRVGAQVPGGPPVQLKAHFLTMTIALEINDSDREADVRAQTPKFLDEMLRSLGSTTVEQLSTVQGRFLLRSKIIGLMNELMKTPRHPGPLVTNVYFSDFMVQ